MSRVDSRPVNRVTSADVVMRKRVELRKEQPNRQRIIRLSLENSCRMFFSKRGENEFFLREILAEGRSV